MGENVFILGAGASEDSGGPLMNNFLDIAEDLMREGAFREHSLKISKVFNVISELNSVYAKSYLDLNNIESLFGVIEMARIIKRLGGYNTNEIEEIREALVALIVMTLDKKIRFTRTSDDIRPTNSYKKFMELLNDKTIMDCSVITFNYDIAIDYAMYYMDVRYDYNLTSDNNPTSRVKLLKMHGSVNWGKCLTCKEIIPFTLDKYFQNQRWPISDKYTTLEISRDLHNLKNFHNHTENKGFEPFIVPPSWNKTEYHSNLTNVWNEAAKQLSQARNIYVFGYSLPSSDSFFRYLFALGTIGDSRIRRFWVFDPDTNVKKRFEDLIGRGISDRFKFFPLKFSDAVDELRNRINL